MARVWHSRFVISAWFVLASASNGFAESDCAAQAVSNNVANSDLTTFMARCQTLAAMTLCEASASEKKLEGSAKKLFIKNCAKDSFGK